MGSHSTLRAHFDALIIALDSLPKEYYKLLLSYLMIYMHVYGSYKTYKCSFNYVMLGQTIIMYVAETVRFDY